MSTSYDIVLQDGGQAGDEDSFVGGRPKLPSGTDVPQCTLCGNRQTFFLQLAFPSDHAWAENSVAIFACTSCATSDHFIPEMVKGPLRGAQVSADFLSRYQRNFRFLVFETRSACVLADYEERVRFRPLGLLPTAASSIGRVGGNPDWVLGDETPGGLASAGAVVFLMQLNPELEFETVDGAPRQADLALDGTPAPSRHPFYQLFIGNKTYLFGPKDPKPNTVYAITQVD